MPESASSRRAWLALAGMIPAVLIVGLDVTVLSVALPTLARHLSASTSQLQWFVMAYSVTFAATIIPSGVLGDRLGRKAVLIGSIVVFAAGSLCCALSTTSAELIGSRALLGVGAGGIATLSLAVINSLFTPDKRAKAIRLMMTVNMLGFPLGPTLGGWMLQHFAWQWVFVINIPIALVAVPVVALAMPESRSSQATRLDLPGLLSSSAAIVALCYGLTEAGSKGWGSTSVWIPLLAGIALAAVFVLVEMHSPHPMVPAAMVRRSTFIAGAAAAAVLSFAIAGVLFLVPQYLQAVLGVSVEASGLYLISFAVGMVVGLPLSARLARLAGRASTVASGLGLLAVGLALAAMTTVSSGGPWLVTWATLTGAAFGIGLPTAMDLALSGLDVNLSGVGSAVLQSLRQVATTIGAAVLGSILSAAYRSALPDLPGSAGQLARKGVEQGLAVAQSLGSAELARDVRAAFVSGMRWATGASAALTAAAALALVAALAVVRIRSRAAAETDSGGRT